MSFVTPEELDALLPHMLAAPRQGRVEILCRRPGFGEREFPDSLTLTAARGIEGERWLHHPWMRLPDGTPDPRIQVSILPKRVLDAVWRDRKGVVHPGDTIISDLLTGEAALPAGTRLQVGEAVLEVSDLYNDACVKWSARYGKPSREWMNRPEHRPYRLRGILCRVVRDGVVRVGDMVGKV